MEESLEEAEARRAAEKPLEEKTAGEVAQVRGGGRVVCGAAAG